VEAAEHCCKSACSDSGDDFSIALLVRRGRSSPLIVFASGLTSQCDVPTRKTLKAAAKLFFSSLPNAGQTKKSTRRHPVTGLLWSTGDSLPAGAVSRASIGGRPSLAVTSATQHAVGAGAGGAPAGLAAGMAGRGGRASHVVGSRDDGSGNGGGGDGGGGGGGSGGGGGGGCGGGGGAAGRGAFGSGNESGAAGVDATPRYTAGAGGQMQGIGARDVGVGHISPSPDATSRYGQLPIMPAVVGNKAKVAATGKRTRNSDVPIGAVDGGSEVAAPDDAPPPEPRTFEVTPDMAAHFKSKFADAGLPIIRKHYTGFLALLKYLYDIRLGRKGRTTPYEPLFPQVGVNVSVRLQYIDDTDVIVPLSMNNANHQNKDATCALLLFMIYDVKDAAYEWILDRYLEGMRSMAVSGTAGKPRVARKKAAAAAATAAAAAATAAGRARGQDGQVAAVAAAAGARSSAGPRQHGRRAPYFPSPPPAPPRLSDDLYQDGEHVGTCTVHLEMPKHHGHDLPSQNVAVFLRSCTPAGCDQRYAFDMDTSFCVESGYPQLMLLSECVNQRVVWPISDIGYVCVDDLALPLPLLPSLSHSLPVNDGYIAGYLCHMNHVLTCLLVRVFFFVMALFFPFCVSFCSLQAACGVVERPPWSA